MFFCVTLFPHLLRAQDCDSNMLVLQHQGDYVVAPSNVSTALQAGFTLECWASASAVPQSAALIQKAIPGGVVSYALGIDSLSRAYVMFHTSSGFDTLFSRPIAFLRQWHHYAAVFQPNDSVYLYIDSIEAASTRISTGGLTTATDSLRIGMTVSPIPLSFLGAIDEVRIWNLPLPFSSIEAEMQQTLALPSAGLVAYFTFDDDASLSIIHDFASGHDARLQGSTVVVPSTAGIVGTLHGFKIRSIEKNVTIGPLVCSSGFDTTIRVYNAAPNDINVSQPSVRVGKEFSIVSSGSFLLHADSSNIQSIQFHFSPPLQGPFQQGPYRDTVIVQSSSVCGGSVAIPIQATYRTAQLSVNPLVLNFGTASNCILPGKRTVTLRNTGNLDMNLLSVDFSTGADFAIDSLTLPFLLKAGSQKTFSIEFLPGADGLVVSSLRFGADECFQSATVSLTGERKSIDLSIPPTVILPPRLATLSSIIIDTVLTLQNTGGLTFNLANVSIQGQGFRLLQGPSKYAFAPGDTSSLVVRFQTSGCGDFSGQLHLHVSQPCTFDTTIPLSIHIEQPSLASGAASYDLGNTCSTSDTVVLLTNTSDELVLIRNVNFTGPDAFTIPAGALPDTLQPQQALSLPVHFAPGHAGQYLSTATVSMLPCGGTSFVIAGSAGLRGVTVSDTLLGFGRGCDVSRVTRNFKIFNASGIDLTVGTAQFSGSSRFAVLGVVLPITIPSGDSQSISIQYSPLTPPERDDASLTLRTVDGCLVNTIHLTGSRETASLQWSAAQVEFDTTCPGETSTITMSLMNRGLDTVDILQSTVSDVSHFTILNAPSSIASGDTGIFQLQFKPSALGPVNGLLSVTTGPCTYNDAMSITLQGVGGPAPQLVVDKNALQFGSIEAGTADTLCIDLSNPSCIPVGIDNSGVMLPAPFHFVSTQTFPLSISRGSPGSLCIVYAPTTVDTSSVNLTIHSVQNVTISLTLAGIGLSPVEQLLDTVLDFGYVVQGTAQTLTARLLNSGNDTAFNAVTLRTGTDFSFIPPSLVTNPQSTNPINVTFSPKSLGVQRDTIAVQSQGYNGKIILRGQGVVDGLTESNIEVDFGDVLIGTGKLDSIKLTATKGFPPAIMIDPLSLTNPFSATISTETPNSIKSDKDTVTLLLNFNPITEGSFTQIDTIHNTFLPSQPTLILTGRGVAPHAALVPSDTLDFGKVQLSTSLSKSISISDTGLYPLDVVNFVIDSNEFVSTSTLPSHIVTGFPQQFPIIFTPTVARPILATLKITSTSTNTVQPVILRARGTYGPANEPDVAYTVENEYLSTGERVLIPVTVSASSPITLDSMRVDLTFDPFAVYFHGMSTVSTLTEGFAGNLVHLNDSTISVRIIGGPKTYANGIAFKLDAEAMLTSHDTSYINILESNPDNIPTPQSLKQGLFIVSDCGNQTGDVSVAANTNISIVQPNPASDIVHMSYTLGSAGLASLKLYDPLGRVTKTVFDGPQVAGSSTTIISLKDIPSGHYVYELSTPMVTRRGVLIVAH
jgi:hypothetical protein